MSSMSTESPAKILIILDEADFSLRNAHSHFVGFVWSWFISSYVLFSFI